MFDATFLLISAIKKLPWNLPDNFCRENSAELLLNLCIDQNKRSRNLCEVNLWCIAYASNLGIIYYNTTFFSFGRAIQPPLFQVASQVIQRHKGCHLDVDPKRCSPLGHLPKRCYKIACTYVVPKFFHKNLSSSQF